MSTLEEAVAGSATGGSGAGLAPRRERGRLPGWVSGAIGVLGLLLLWELLAVTVLDTGHVLPTPVAVAKQIWDDRDFYPLHLSKTASEAARGWLIGNGLAIGLAVLFFGVPIAERVLLQIGVASYCLPVIAIGPILSTVFNGDAPQTALAGISVFFTTLIGVLLGLKAADPASLDLVRACGGGGIRQLRFVRLRAALPSTFAALRIAAPAAVLGAIIGEYLGGDRGLGIAMVNSQQALDVPRTWGLAIVASAVAGVGYAGTALLGRLLTPWAPRGAGGGTL